MVLRLLLPILLLLSLQSEASFRSEIAVDCKNAILGFLARTTAYNKDNLNLTFHTEAENGPQEVNIHFGKKLDMGVHAVILRLKEISIPEILKGWNPASLIVKIGHRIAGIPEKFQRGLFDNHGEKKAYDILLSSHQLAMSSSYYPKDPAWGDSKPPIVPIVASLETDRGLLEFKPFAVGMGLKALRKAYGDKLPPEMIQSLQEIFLLSAAIEDKVLFNNKPFRMDINPQNLMWIRIADNPELTRELGLKRDCFIIVEGDVKRVGPYYSARSMSFEDYLEIFMTYIRKITPHAS